MNHWLLKTEPSDYSYDDLVRDKHTIWDGVANNQALIFLREMKKGDSAFIYHTGKERAIVGIAGVTRGPYPDPKLDNDKLVVVGVTARLRVPHPVTLAAIKSDPAFADFHLVRISRLSVMPVLPAMWKKLCTMAGVVHT